MTMPVQRKLRDLVNAGAVLVGDLSHRSPSLSIKKNSEEFMAQ